MTERPDNAGVRVPPPALYALAVLAGYLLDRRWPLPVGDSGLVQGLAWLLMLVWLSLTVSSIGKFWRSHINRAHSSRHDSCDRRSISVHSKPDVRRVGRPDDCTRPVPEYLVADRVAVAGVAGGTMGRHCSRGAVSRTPIRR